MAENNRNQNQTSENSNIGNRTSDQNTQSQNISNQDGQNQNPQGGDHWNNYRTRELSDEGTGAGKATTPAGE